jgi:hypothetical protein
VNDLEKVPERRVFKVKLPMSVRTSSKKKQALNLNVYRNLHFRSLSAQKNKFQKVVKKLLRGIPPLGVITLHYVVYPGSKRRLDVMNVGSIVDKYFSDTLTIEGIIEDDDYTHIPHVSFAFGEITKDDGHILVIITEIEPKKENTPMRVMLDQDDIQTALTTYVSSLNLPNAFGVKLDVVNDEITAEIVFGNTTTKNDVPGEVTPSKKRGRGGRPAGSKNKLKNQEVTADVDNTVQDGAADSSGGDAEGATEETPTTTEEKAPTTKASSRKNLFGDEETPSSEDDGTAETPTSDDAPEPVKRGSIFDS